MLVFWLISFTLYISPCFTLNNGLAKTPPMGWLHWQRFRCNLDCENYPNDCIRDQLFREMADVMVRDGWKDAGYEFVIIDDCWLAPERDENDRLQPDPDRFPDGIKALADYVHDQGLKFGIYEDYGTSTCAGYPGSMGYVEIDANTFAEWGVDYLKLDGCHSNYDYIEQGQLDMAAALANTGRPIVFSCESPVYKGLENTNFTAVAEACNLWRTHNDVDDSWSSVKSIIDWHAENQNKIILLAGPGQWNDPDMLVIGNFGLSYDQSIYQMAIWAILASPLIISTDLRTIKPEFAAILQNPDIIRINQDPLGLQGLYFSTDDVIDIWLRGISPTIEGHNSFAIAVTNKGEGGFPRRTLVDLSIFGTLLDWADGYELKSIFGDVEERVVKLPDTIEVRVNPTGAVVFTLTPVVGKI